jgi:hypothetical protein
MDLQGFLPRPSPSPWFCQIDDFDILAALIALFERRENPLPRGRTQYEKATPQGGRFWRGVV